MTKLLEQAFSAASRLPADEQDAVAARLLEDIASEQQWDRAFEDSPDALAALAAKALAEFHAGRTLPQNDDDRDLTHD
jgi:hypothetical protein